LADFNLGYGVSAVLAICFLTLGAYIIYGTGTELSNSSPVFAEQLISIFTGAIGDWSYYVIAVAAFATMFSTSITVIDGYSRAVSRTIMLMFDYSPKRASRHPYVAMTVVLAIGTYLVISQYLNSLKQLVDLATVVSFVIAPLAGYLNYRVILAPEVGEKFSPPPWLKGLAIAGLIFLSTFTLIFVWVKIHPEGVTSFINHW